MNSMNITTIVISISFVVFIGVVVVAAAAAAASIIVVVIVVSAFRYCYLGCFCDYYSFYSQLCIMQISVSMYASLFSYIC